MIAISKRTLTVPTSPPNKSWEGNRRQRPSLSGVLRGGASTSNVAERRLMFRSFEPRKDRLLE